MVFSSHLFLFYFLPLALGIYYALARAPQRARNLALALLGYVFYGWANPQFVPIMFATTLLDWYASLVIARNDWFVLRRRFAPIEQLSPGARNQIQRAALLVSILSNLGMLGFFKYFNFGIDSYVGLAHAVGLSAVWHPAINVVLPLGISFYTFQSLSYTIDVYRGEAKAVSNFIDFACFVSMFPHLVAGPILKFSFLASQLQDRKLTLDKFARGTAFFSVGLAEKILLANPCGKVADLTFGAGSLHILDAWYGAVAYAFQIFFDFSGYSDMAIGLGLMLGFVFAKNFDAPYRSASITEFWRRWHISLSSWLREYLYIPLGGSRLGTSRTYANLITTMLLGGLWHGAAWNFVLWGGLHGTALAIERSRAGNVTDLPKWLKVAVTFVVVVVGWVLFRADSIHDAGRYMACMLGCVRVHPQASLIPGLIYKPYYLLIIAVAAIIAWVAPTPWDWTQRITLRKSVACLGLFWLAIILLTTQSYNPFIYFRF
jgi:alginate O-acetyltransferase complex protein AlgI